MTSYKEKEPEPYGPIPSSQQLKWHRMEFYGFIHFTVNTFTDKEWGYGDEDPSIFNPTNLDARQWARVARDAGMKGLILTCKHHDGFCLWPSKYTEHSVQNSSWKNGKGDVVGELAAACEEFDLKFGVYLSPWDRNHPQYGNQEYLTYYRNQLSELLTKYGSVFEVWFDGANGGDGYYGGARETRKIDKKTYYDWENTWQIVRELQPEAVMFSDAGPDIRWVGNEKGIASSTTWCTFNSDDRYPGYNPPGYDPVEDLGKGHENGNKWIPPETDVSIRPGWFYHESENPKSVDKLLEIYYKSIGRGSTLNLNLPPDHRGLFAENDIDNLMKLRQKLDQIFDNNLVENAQIKAVDTRGKNGVFAPENLSNADPQEFWAAKNGVKDTELVLEFPEVTEFDHIVLKETIRLGQRIKSWEIEIYKDGSWDKIAEGTTIGYKRILPLEKVRTQKVKLKIKDSKACPLLNQIGIYNSDN